jgi:phosphoribosyl 1,2-cyclic phosphate phosphodiesterase
MNVTEALETAAAIRPRQTLLTHISHDLSHIQLEATLPASVRIAYDGMKVPA